jgi:DNA-binding MltR family transcriptional regulator
MDLPRGFSPNPEDSKIYYADMAAVRSELQSQSDRGAAIVGVALLDDKLRTILEFAFPNPLSKRQTKGLFGPTAPLGSYDAKVRLASALGLFADDLVHDLNILGRVRNKFAHDLSIREFADPAIAPFCELLNGYRIESLARDGTSSRIVQYKDASDARAAYILSVEVAVHFILISSQERLGRGTPLIIEQPGPRGV